MATSRIELPRGELGSAALAAVERLARASGHPLRETSTGVPTKSAGADTVAWIVFALGAAVMVLARSASLRARPPRLTRAHH